MNQRWACHQPCDGRRAVGADLCVRPPNLLMRRPRSPCRLLAVQYPMPHRSLPHRKSLRLPHFDYSQPGAYFITMCTRDRHCLFGCIADSIVQLNHLGTLVQATWRGMPPFYNGLLLDEFVVMPNHLHAILFFCASNAPLSSTNGRTQRSAPTPSLPHLIRRFKSITTASFRHHSSASGSPPRLHPVWQRGYYEHVIRNDRSLERIREYIANNPAQWALDRENPDFIPPATTPNDTEPWMV